MKKILLLSVFAISILTAQQASAQLTATTTLNIVLEDVMQIAVGSPSTTLTFDSFGEYQSGVVGSVTDLIQVSSTRSYKVTVKAGDVTNPSSLDITGISLVALKGTNNTGYNDNATFSSQSLSTSEKQLISSTGHTYDSDNDSALATFDLEYAIAEDGAYLGKAAGTNIIPLVFTLSAP